MSRFSVMLLLDIVIINEHLFECLWVAGIIELLEKVKHLVKFLETEVTQDLLFVQIPESWNIVVFFLVFQIEACLNNIFTLKLFDVIRINICDFSFVTGGGRNNTSWTRPLQERYFLGCRKLLIKCIFTDLNVVNCLVR